MGSPAGADSPVTTDSATGELAACLPAEGTEAEIVAPDAPPRYLELGRRVEEAVAAHPEEMVAALEQAGDQPVPYATWMGLTEAEYEELQELSEDAHEWGLIAVGREPLSVTVEGATAEFEAAGEFFAPLDGVQVDIGARTATIGSHTLTAAPFEADGGAAGALSGWEWTADADAVYLLVAAIEGTQDCFLQFRDGVARPGLPSTVEARYPRR